VAQTTKAFTDYFGGFGYAFARVEAKPQIDRVNNRVALVLSAQPSRRAYVRRISIEGNNRTRDQVIRREFRQLESAWYDSERIKLSRDRVDRLGFFTQVAVDTVEVPDAPDQVDLVISVSEKPTGNLTLGAGFSQAEKLSLIAGIQQENLLGSGNYLGLNVNTSKYNRQLSLTTTDPYFTSSGISRTFDLYYRTSQPLTTQEGNYKLTTPGVALRFGVPFSETDTVYFGAGLEQTKIDPGNGMPRAYQTFINDFGDSPSSLPLTVGWGRDTRDSALVPSTGRLQRLNGEVGVAGDTRYAKASYQFQQYIALNKKFTLAFNAEAGWGEGLSGKPFPMFKNFYGGGLGSVRGFEQGTLGGRSCILDASGSCNGTFANIGGAKKVVFNTEVIAPFPGAGNDRTLRMYGFLDIGNVYGEGDKLDVADLRASTGAGISWISPIGPLRIAYARPLRKQDDDKTQSIQFQIGTSF
jgi:outer membrane protein insertion porin family